MNTRPRDLVRERERLVAAIAEQRLRLKRAYGAARAPLQVADRIREGARYVLVHKAAVWTAFTAAALVMRLVRARRRTVRARRRLKTS